MATHVSKKDFAALYGCSKAYVSQLVASKRLVLDDEGKRVDVEASFELLGVTADPSKAAVRERWNAYRQDQGKPAPAVAASVAPAATPAPRAETAAADESEPKTPVAEPRASAYHDARTLREQSQARLAQLDLQKALGEALDAEPTLRAVMDAHTTARVEIMMLPDRLAQLVAPEIDPRKCYDLIRAECERTCLRMVEHLKTLGAKAKADPALPAAPAAPAAPQDLVAA
jgi:hypothetical protein